MESSSASPLPEHAENYMYELCVNLTERDVSSNLCSNSTNYGDIPEDSSNLEYVVAVVVAISFTIIVLVGLIGNSLVVLVVACNQQMKSTTNILIINLAVADLLFICCCVPFTATDYIFPYWPFGDLWCKMVQYLIVVTAYASVYTLVLMSLDRFLAVVHPIASMYVRTEHNACTAIFVQWGIILLMSSPAFFRHGEVPYMHYSQEFSSCIFLVYDPVQRPNGYNQMIYQVFFFLTSYAIPLILICGLYLVMLTKLWRGVAPGHVAAENRRRRKVTRLVVVVVLIFALCWLPIQVILLLKTLNLYEINEWNVVLQITSQIAAYANSCLNPILYAFLSENFRKAFRKIMSMGEANRGANGLSNGRAVADAERSANQTRSTRINNELA